MLLKTQKKILVWYNSKLVKLGSLLLKKSTKLDGRINKIESLRLKKFKEKQKYREDARQRLMEKLEDEILMDDTFLEEMKDDYRKFLKTVKKRLIFRSAKDSQGKCECDKCKFYYEANRMTIDHIVPVAILKDFGFSEADMMDEENYSLMCQYCNVKKSHHLDFSNPHTYRLLQKYLSMVKEDAIQEKHLEFMRKKNAREAKLGKKAEERLEDMY